MLFVKRVCLIISFCVLIICGMFIFLFGTNVGMNLMFTRMINHIPGITFDSISGVWGDVSIINLVYHMPNGILKIGKLHLSIDLKHFFVKKMNIKNLILENVFLSVDKINFSNKKIKNKGWYQINDFFYPKKSIIIKHIALFNINIISNETTLQFQEINTGVIFHNNLLKILPTYIIGVSILNKACVMNIPMRTIYSLQDLIIFGKKDLLNSQFMLGNFIKNKLIKECIYKIPSNLLITDLKIKGLKIGLIDKNYHIVNDLCVKIIYNTNLIKLEMKVNLPVGYLNGIGEIKCKKNYPVHVMINYVTCNNIENCPDQSNSNLEKVKLVIIGELLNELCMKFDYTNFISTACVLFRIKLMHFGVPVSLLIKIEQMPVFVCNNRNKFILKNFNLYLVGKINNYYINIQSKLVDSETTEIYDISVHAQGNMDGCTVSTLKVGDILNGYGELQGVVCWNQGVSWSSVCTFEKINIVHKLLKYPIKLSGKVIMKGRWCIDSWELAVSQIELQGKINNNNIICSGSMYVKSDGQWDIPMFLINCNDFNILKIHGGLSKDRIFRVNAVIKLSDRVVCFSKFNGNMYGHCSLYGSITSPKFSWKLSNCSLCFKNKNINIDNIIMNGDIYYDGVMRSNFFIEVEKIRYKNFLLHKLYMNAKGCLKKHFFNFIIVGDELSGNIDIEGAFNCKNQFWNGKISKTDIITIIGKWTLTQDIICTYHHKFRKIIFESHYWKNDICQISISDVMQKNMLKKVNVILKNFDVVITNIDFIDLISINNIYVYCKDFSWVLGKKLPCAVILISGSECKIKYFNKNDIFDVVSDCIKARIIINQINLFCHLAINTNENSYFGEFLVSDIYSNIPEISGNLKIENMLCKPFFRLLRLSKETIDGLLSVNINFKGDLRCPRIYGCVKLINCKIYKPDTLFFLKNGTLEIKYCGDYAIFSGSMDTGYDGKIYIHGKVMNFYSIQDIDVTLKVQGEQVNLHISEEIYIKVSSNIVCKITAHKIDIQGCLEIPWACIKVQEFSKNMIEIASEEVVLDENFVPIVDYFKGFTIPVFSNFMIRFGDDVNFHGLGLHVKLKGDLKIIYHKEDLILIGHINVSSGDFKAYGQNLTIKRGQLLFSGSINQVYLDIEGIRNSEFVSADKINEKDAIGIRVSGMIDKLKLEFFSSPLLLPQQKKASYLLGINNLVFVDAYDINNLMTSLLIGASMDRCANFINKIGNTLGIQDLTLNTQDFGTTSSSLALSGYITPELQIKYGINIFDLLTTITVRYRLHPKLYLEAILGGHSQALDLLYQIDF